MYGSTTVGYKEARCIHSNSLRSQVLLPTAYTFLIFYLLYILGTLLVLRIQTHIHIHTCS